MVKNMLRKQIPFFIVLCLLVVAPVLLFGADTSTITLGGKEGWSSLSLMDSVAFGTGRFGYEAVEVATDVSRLSPETDLLVSFENNLIADSSGHYTVVQKNMDFSSKTIKGKSAGMNRGSSTGFVLQGADDALFGSKGLTGSFTIEFWLCPSLTENGEQVLHWRSSRTIANTPVYQVIRASFFNNRFEWVFNNIFGAEGSVISEVVLTSESSVIPQKWAHHAISYDDDIGLLEYRINGAIEAVRYVTSNNKESGEVMNAYFGAGANLVLCSKFSGLIDDFVIRRDSYAKMRHQTYAQRGGRFESNPLESGGFNSVLDKLDAVYSEPAETGVAFYVRGGDNFYEWTPEYPEWVPVLPGEKIEGVYGKYFQVACDLYPDGNGEKTPSVSEIKLSYTETTPPLPPAVVSAKAGNGYVDLTWLASIDFNTGGYTIYYGERPGEYLGTIAIEGKSPLNVGNVLSYRLSGLMNGRIYYFAVSAYSSLDNRISGALSKEVYARPLRKVK